MRSWLCLFLLTCSVIAHAEDQPSVLVKTEPMRKESIIFKLSGYGSVFSDPKNTVNFDQPRSGQIISLNVMAGQIVKRGDALYEFETDPAAAYAYAQAKSSLEMASSEFESMKRLYAQQLATHAQLAAAKKALKDAQSAFETQNKLGDGLPLEIVKAPFDGVIAGSFASPGDRVQTGKTVLQLARLGALRARIGVQPEDALKIKLGMTVKLLPVFDKTRQLNGAVSEIHGSINPQTQLVDVIAQIDKSQNPGLIPGMKLRGVIQIQGADAWVVPRSAVLSDENGAYIFQDDMGHAKRVNVNAIESGGMTAIQGKFDPALSVVVLGNYELHDGMTLRKEQSR